MICTHSVAVNMEQVHVTVTYSNELENLVVRRLDLSNRRKQLVEKYAYLDACAAA
jgi:hypothetical protein